MSHKTRYLVSACLCGIPCRYDGKSVKDERIEKLVRMQKAVPICPEILGGLSIPREPFEIAQGEGKDVLSGTGLVLSRNGKNMTPFLLRGAFASLSIAQKFKIKKAWMKKKSPSCGCEQTLTRLGGWIKRKGESVKGDGVTVSLFKRSGIKVMLR
jgi:uncharacterized protein YbbK (DUF523 family)